MFFALFFWLGVVLGLFRLLSVVNCRFSVFGVFVCVCVCVYVSVCVCLCVCVCVCVS